MDNERAEQERDRRIRDRAYELWELAGRPDGQQADHWEQARREIDGDESGGRESYATGETIETGAEPSVQQAEQPDAPVGDKPGATPGETGPSAAEATGEPGMGQPAPVGGSEADDETSGDPLPAMKQPGKRKAATTEKGAAERAPAERAKPASRARPKRS